MADYLRRGDDGRSEARGKGSGAEHNSELFWQWKGIPASSCWSDFSAARYQASGSELLDGAPAQCTQ